MRIPSKARNITLSLFFIALLFAGGAASVRGQSALDGFNPTFNGLIRAIVVQPDGKILVGGDFTASSTSGPPPIPRTYIARLNPDGSLDTAFNPTPNGIVYSIALQADGKILVGGEFFGPNGMSGQPRNHIARLDSTTGAPDSFDPNASSTVYSIAVQGDGKILAGGRFTTIGGQTRNYIARLDPTSGLADSFDPNATSFIRAMVVQADGKILTAGDFNGPNSIGGQPRNFLARLDGATGAADSFNPSANSTVFAIALLPDGKILAGGGFFGPNSIGGKTRNYIARLDPTTGSADSFDPNASGSAVFAIVVQPDCKILVGGQFTSIGGQTRHNLARLDVATGLADFFDPNTDSGVLSLAVQTDGKVLAGGAFAAVAPNGGASVTRNRLARLASDGTLDLTVDLGIIGPAGSTVTATAIQADGKILIGGLFTTVLGVTRNNMARLNPDGTLDVAFDPNANDFVYSIVVQADGKILVAGNFNGANSIGGQARNRIARLDAITGLADSFDPNANQSVRQLAVQADGRILASGSFFGPNSIGGQTRNYIARLDPTTGLADSFDPNANFPVESIAVQSDGRIVAGGNFTNIGGQPRTRIARLDPATGLADSFDPNANSDVIALAVQSDGKILAGGLFTSIGGQMRRHIARLDPTNGLADSFDPNANSLAVHSIVVQADGKILAGGSFNGVSSIGGQMRNRIARLDAVTGVADSFDPNAGNNVDSVALQADGKIVVGGAFASIGGQPRDHFARLSNDTAALQGLTVTQTEVTWTLHGSAPQFTRVTFESSPDNVTYTPLGSSTAIGNDWKLTGLSLSTGQNTYVRARGYYRSGYFNGSESIVETVRHAFIPQPPQPPVIISPLSANGTVGQQFTYQIVALHTPTSYTASNLPPGLSFNAALGTISGTPSAAGTQNVTIGAANSAGNDSKVVSISFNPAPAAGSPIITSVTAATGKTNDPFSFQVTASNVTSAAAIAASGLPAGLSVNANTGLISGTVTSDGSYGVSLTLTDGSAMATGSLQLTFTSDPAYPVIISPSSATLVPGQPFTYTIVAPGNGGGPVTCSISGALPAGLTFDPNTCTISGTYNPPTALSEGRAAFGAGGDSPYVRSFGGSSGFVLANVQLFAHNSAGTASAQLTFVVAQPTAAVNISTRAVVGTGDNVLIGGFILTGTGPKRLIIRAIAPSTGVVGALQDPTLELRGSNGLLLQANDDWQISQEQAIRDTTIPPIDSRESAIVITLQPGSYTAVVGSKGGATGPALVEVYDLDGAGDSQLAQIATRGNVQRDDKALIGGFIVTGGATANVLVRGIGPELTQANVPNALQDPTLELYNGNGDVIASNDDWESDQRQAIIDTTAPPQDPREPAIVRSITAGNYTAIVRGKHNSVGVALVEIYVLE
jgi:uncharacterized delta-60 repeat protein/uncharacterized repeat protein (TIGR01451 family)